MEIPGGCSRLATRQESFDSVEEDPGSTTHRGQQLINLTNLPFVG